MTERVDIANQALLWLGEDVITSLEDDLDRARVMRVNYIPARDQVLEAHEWSFAITRFKPASLDDTDSDYPVWGPEKAYKPPADILRVLSCHRDEDFSVSYEKEQIQWVMENGLILCEEEVIYCRGIQRIEQEGKFSAGFVQALAAKLAVLAATALTASADIQNNMLQLYGAFLSEAKSRDGMQGRSRRIRNRTLLKSR